jgi:hypothetical protein
MLSCSRLHEKLSVCTSNQVISTYSVYRPLCFNRPGREGAFVADGHYQQQQQQQQHQQHGLQDEAAQPMSEGGDGLSRRQRAAIASRAAARAAAAGVNDGDASLIRGGPSTTVASDRGFNSWQNGVSDRPSSPIWQMRQDRIDADNREPMSAHGGVSRNNTASMSTNDAGGGARQQLNHEVAGQVENDSETGSLLIQVISRYGEHMYSVRLQVIWRVGALYFLRLPEI